MKFSKILTFKKKSLQIFRTLDKATRDIKTSGIFCSSQLSRLELLNVLSNQKIGFVKKRFFEKDKFYNSWIDKTSRKANVDPEECNWCPNNNIMNNPYEKEDKKYTLITADQNFFADSGNIYNIQKQIYFNLVKKISWTFAKNFLKSDTFNWKSIFW